MASLERETASSSERQGNISFLTYGELHLLVSNNKTTMILNKVLYEERFGEHGIGFDLNQCDPIRVVDVRLHNGKIIQFIEDGNHRAIAGLHWGSENKQPDEPYLPVRNVTSNYNSGPLTPEQYIETIINPTKAHTEIAPERMSYTLLTQWEQMVGPEIAQKFSGIAALQKKRYTPAYFHGSTPDEQRLLKEKLTVLQEIIKKTGYSSDEVFKKAVTLISTRTKASALDNDQVIQQLEGLFYHPSIYPKLLRGSADEPASKTVLSSLAMRLLKAFSRFSLSDDGTDTIKKSSEREAILEILFDKQTSITDVESLIIMQSPQRVFKDWKKEQTRKNLEQAYRALLPEGTLPSAYAQKFLSQLKFREEDQQWVLSIIVNVTTALEKADRLLGTTLPPPQRQALEEVRGRLLLANLQTYSSLLKQFGSVLAALKEPRQDPPTPVAEIVFLPLEATSPSSPEREDLQKENETLRRELVKLRAENDRLRTLLGEAPTPVDRTPEIAPAPIVAKVNNILVIDLGQGDLAGIPLSAGPAQTRSTTTPSSLQQKAQVVKPHATEQLFIADWRRHGNCAYDPEVMFVSGNKQQAAAKKICEGCQVQAVCLATALRHEVDHVDDTFGVAGGKTQRERRALIKNEQENVKKLIRAVDERMNPS